MASNTVMITGANRGIGLGLAKAYAHGGWRVLAVCRSPEKATALQVLAKEVADKLIILKADVGKEEEIQALARELADESIDILINNVGILLDSRDGRPSATTGDLSFAALLESFQVNAVGPLVLSQALLQPLLRGDKKIIVNMNSTLGSISQNNEGSYYCYRGSKAAFNALTRNLAMELKGKGVTVISLSPGWVQTDMGGAAADLTVEESVGFILKLISRLSLADTGKFLSHEGEELAW